MLRQRLLQVYRCAKSVEVFCRWLSFQPEESQISPREQELLDVFKIQMTGTRSVHELNRSKQRIEEEMPKLSAISIARLIYSCKLGNYADPSLMSHLLDAVKDQTVHGTGFGCNETAMMIYSLGSLHKQTGDNFDAALSSKAQEVCLELIEKLSTERRLSEITNRCLSNTLYGLGFLFKQERANYKQNLHFESCMKALCHEVCQDHRLRQFAQQALANIMFGVGCLKWKDEQMLLMLSREIINRVRGFKCKEIASILLSITKLKFHHRELIITLGIEAAGAHRAPKFNEQEFCNLLHGFAVMLERDLSLMQTMEPVINGLLYEAGSPVRLERYSLQDLSTLLYSIAVFSQKDYSSQKPWICHLISTIVDKSVLMLSLDDDLNAFHSANVLYACARMNFHHEPLIERLNEAIEQKKLKLDDLRTVSLLLWGFTTLRCLTKSVFLTLSEEIVSLREKGAKLTERNWVQLTQALYYFKRQNEGIELSPKIKDLFEEAINTEKTTNLNSLTMMTGTKIVHKQSH